MQTPRNLAAVAFVAAALTAVSSAASGSFDSSSCYAAPPTPAVQGLNGEMSAELWVYPEAGGATTQGLLGTWDDVNGNYRTWFVSLSSLVPTVFCADTPTTAGSFSGPGAIALNAWTHLAFTRSSTGAAALYKNGVQWATFTFPATMHTAANPLRIGCTLSGGVGVQFFKGYMDGVRVFSVERGGGAVLGSACTTGASSAPGLVAEYLFSEGSGAVLADTAASQNTAVVSHGTPGWQSGDATDVSVCPVTPAPVTPVPSTPAPATPAPATPVPVTPVPATPVPATHVPPSPVPATPWPPTPVPPTPVPMTPVPATPWPPTPVPATPVPMTPVPATSLGAATCAHIATLCGAISVECAILRAGGQLGAASDCDKAVLACTHVADDCDARLTTCPLA